MHVVSVINYKGGVGKTSLTANLGAELAWRGKRVLLIDLDAQASLHFHLLSQTNGVKTLRQAGPLRHGLTHTTVGRPSTWQI